MTKSDDGGPAFPGASNARFDATQGMSLRDWFAGQALIGLRANDKTLHLSDDVAFLAWSDADEMIRQRDGSPRRVSAIQSSENSAKESQ